MKAQTFFEKFRPLTYYEICTEKTFRVLIGDTGWDLECDLMNAISFVRFFQYSQTILAAAKDIAELKNKKGSGFSRESVSLLTCFSQMIALVYESCKKPKWPWRRVMKRQAMHRYYLKHVDELFDVYEKLMAYQSRLFFLLRGLANWKLFQTTEWKPTGSSKFASPSLRTLTDGFALWQDMSIKNSSRLFSTN